MKGFDCVFVGAYIYSIYHKWKSQMDYEPLKILDFKFNTQ